jgi:dipeptidyl aminopeptidase/acylaminoacyl peptidase
MIKTLKTGNVRTVQAPDRDYSSGFPSFRWRSDSEHLIYWHSKESDENYHLMQYDPRDQSLADLTPFKNSHARLLAQNENFILFEANNRDATTFDVYKVDLKSGKISNIYQNPGETVDWIFDKDYNIMGIVKGTGNEKGLFLRTSVAQSFEAPAYLPKNFNLVQLVDDNFEHDALLVRARLNGDGASLVLIHPKAKKYEIVMTDPHFEEVAGTLNAETGSVRTLRVTREKSQLSTPDPKIQKSLDQIREKIGNDFSIVSADKKDENWVVTVDSADVPDKYYLFKRATGSLEFLFFENDGLEKRSFAKMEPISFPASDGMKLYGYFTRPTYVPPGGSADKPPLVVMVHGGPRSRDHWAYHSSVQWLATRGYAVLQVNFRGSTGYGKAYYHAGFGQWGGKMTSDVIDGKNWVLSQGWADPKRVCIMGGSYGAYAVLDALWRFPKDFFCGIANSGVYDLAAMRDENPEHWKRYQEEEDLYLPEKGKNRARLIERSPLYHVNKIETPLLLSHGTSDIRCKESQTAALFKALKSQGKKAKYLKMPNGGHSFFTAITYREEEFLSEYLGGYFQPGDTMDVLGDYSE